ncbi:hypothetical protein Pla110_20570 [Polystyrenella longa]|uniref:Uncharacterized protein n=1 Tax=Polystyrenella longa TaxID=2528007 RepID=A0A518CM68_9PLAN|nr:hypothetical protein [Polystyrenella longa]QDU80330.1 hypothetical protein Pla110_20570 [Polystyrenella longa]
MSRDYSEHQKKIIGRYYDNRESIDSQKLSELVTNLYLETSEKKKAKHWERAEKMMERLEVPKSRIAHILEKEDPAILAELVKDIESGKALK